MTEVTKPRAKRTKKADTTPTPPVARAKRVPKTVKNSESAGTTEKTVDSEYILRHPKFNTFLELEIKNCTPVAKEGRFKRTPFNVLRENGQLTVDKVLAEFYRICEKTSQLPSSQRAAIDNLIINAAQHVLKYDTQMQKIKQRVPSRKQKSK